MTDCLEAPVPYLIGLHARYLQEIEPSKRPHGVVFVDIDRDVVHLGFDDSGRNRELPSLPSRDALKLKATLNEFGSPVYLIPDSGIEGCILMGDSLLMINKERPDYAQMSNVVVNAESLGRTEVFSITDKAYRDEDLSAAVSGFRSIHGHLEEDSDEENIDRPSFSKSPNTMRAPRRKVSKMFVRNRTKSSIADYDKARAQGHLLEMVEPPGFSSKELRNAFLRFLVTIFKGYRSFLLAEKHDLFDENEFVDDQQLSEANLEFLQLVLKTQLFQRFLEERRDNPNHPEMRFFDESIIAKNNRSRKHTLTKGGKKPTPFLDDESGKVRQSFVLYGWVTGNCFLFSHPFRFAGDKDIHTSTSIKSRTS
jgi:DENN domain-containing protein 5